MLDRLFTAHPRSVDETYWQHLRTASGFGLTMMMAGVACTCHAVVPGLFAKTGSRAIEKLHDRMVSNRGAASSQTSRMSGQN